MLNEATRNFIHQHLEDDVRQLALQGGKNPEVDLPLALEQIAGRQKARLKIPSWATIDGMLYPPHLSMEQCSSEPTAKYKARMAGEGGLFVDLTTGFGVDAAFISKGFSKAVCIECKEQLCIDACSSDLWRRNGVSEHDASCRSSNDRPRQEG